MEYCKTVRNEGIDINERDREALYEAKLDYIPDPMLAKAHLLLDGGYVERAGGFLKEYVLQKNSIMGHKLEYHFLMARYELAVGNKAGAINEFKKTIDLGVGEDYSFACEAALLLGNTYETTDEPERAEEYYELSLKLYQSSFYEYLEDKASKALKQLKS
jgi:tetratricopeptide (TPR) repeat protein